MGHEKILEQLKRFTAGEISDQSLEDWVLSHLQGILDSHDMRAIDMANELDALFIEHGEGLLSSEQLTADLTNIYLREAQTVRIQYGPLPMFSSSGQPTVRKTLGSPEVSVGALSDLPVAC